MPTATVVLLLPKASSKVNDDTYRWIVRPKLCHPSEARCTLNKEILDLLNELEGAVVELVYKFDEKSTASV